MAGLWSIPRLTTLLLNGRRVKTIIRYSMIDIDHSTFKAEVGNESLNVARAALLFARGIAYPDLRPSRYITRLDHWADAASRKMTAKRAIQRTRQLFEFMFDEVGLQGNRDDYTDPRNSFLNEVMDRRLGLPITLSVIFLELAGRLNLNAEGVGLPGHFIVAAYDEEDQRHLFDPFNSGVAVTEQQAIEIVRRTAGYTGSVNPSWFDALAPRAIIARMLFNLRGTYIAREAWNETLATLDHLRALQPSVAEHSRDMGLAYLRKSEPRKAVEMLEQYLVLKPDAADVESIRNSLAPLIDRLARLN